MFAALDALGSVHWGISSLERYRGKFTARGEAQRVATFLWH